MSARLPSQRVFPGWYLVAYLMYTQVVTLGFLFYGFGVILDPVGHSLGMTRGQTAYGFSLFTLGCAVWSPFMGWWVERRGPRIPFLIGITMLAAALVALGQVHSRWSYYGVMALWVSFGVAAASGVPSSTLVVNWFRRRRGMAISMTSAGVSLGGLCLAPLVGWLIPQIGWERAILLPAALTALAIPLGAKVIRNRPEEVGLFRDGDAVDVPDADAGTTLTFRDVIGDRRFQIVATSFAIALSCMTSLMVHVVALWTDMGMPQHRATLAFALLAGIGMVGKPFFGWLADHVDARVGAALSYGLLMLGTLTLLWPSTWNVVPFVVFFGLGIGGAVPMQTAINGSLYGREHFARVSGILTPVIVTVQSAFYALTGYFHDAWGGYGMLLVIYAVFYAGAIALLFRLKLPPPISEPLGEPQLSVTPAAASML